MKKIVYIAFLAIVNFGFSQVKLDTLKLQKIEDGKELILNNDTLSLTIQETFSLKIDKEGYYSLRIGRESTPIYLIKGKNIRLTLNAKEFDESLSYTGDIAGENNYLAAKYL